MRPILAYGPLLDKELRACIKGRKGKVDPSMPWGDDLLERLESFAGGGKLLRGSVLCWTYQAFSGRKPDEAVIDAAVALELTHSALLIHDDIMDDDDMRRGRPSMHEQYRLAAEREDLPDSVRFGANMALAGGDAAFFMAFGLLGKARAARADHRFYDLFADQMLLTCAGQMQDVYLDAKASMPAKRAIHELMRTKTASYTLALPLTMGAAMADQPSGVLRRLQAIGITGGTIFQIRDDELGVLGDSEKTGKPVGADIKEGKKTLFYYYLHEACSAAERRRLKGIFGNRAATGEDIRLVRDLAVRHKVPGALEEEIDRLNRKAVAGIDDLPLSAARKAVLKSLINFCARRQH
ncbi:MAG TPA: polyprenyl synthetase family protein [Candidatus Saccharimonadales bacterium]|nr:polyprenyl synthetase family protein [Candidatus Saccharimonadales bacterium]